MCCQKLTRERSAITILVNFLAIESLKLPYKFYLQISVTGHSIEKTNTTMAKNKNDVGDIKTAFGEREGQARPLLAIILITLAILVFVALLDYDPSNNRHVNSDARGSQNAVGWIGDEVAFGLYYGVGYACWLVPILLLRFGLLCFQQKTAHLRLGRVLAAVPLIFVVSGIAALYDAQNYIPEKPAYIKKTAEAQNVTAYHKGSGGDIGCIIYGPPQPQRYGLMKGAVGPFGSGLLYSMLFIVLAIPIFFSEPTKFFYSLRDRLVTWRNSQLAAMKQKAAERKELYVAQKEQKKLLREKLEQEKKAAHEREITDKKTLNKSDGLAKGDKKTASSLSNKGSDYSVLKSPVDTKSTRSNLSAEKNPDVKTGSPDSAFAPPAVEQSPAETAPAVIVTGGLKVIQGETVEKALGHLPERKGAYIFPLLELLAEPPARVQSDEDYAATAALLVQTLSQFKVEVELGEVHSGPVITRYEVIPAPGVRVNKIEALDKDLALGLKAQSVRILAPVPGKGSVGIEVPNRKPAPVFLRDIIESRAWADSDAEIPIVLGKEVTGKPIVIDLTKMPHMLIAGSTGSGKSVCINTVIASLLFKTSPDDMRFIMVDPKMVELKVYNDLPHMLVPVVTDPKKVTGALKYLIKEMEYRYQTFSEVGVRNIAGFNARILKDKESRDKAAALDAILSPEERNAIREFEVPRDKGIELPTEKLPYIVCIIDELADLMMVAPADIEHCIMRLTQLARAAGIHLILATQRPSVNVITGVIKSNIPTRIAFKVASNVDSRTILDGKGAEALIGKGDMLFTPPGSMSLVRAQGAFVSDDEITKIVDFVRSKNGPPVFDSIVQRQIEAESQDGDGDDNNGDDAPDWDDPLVKDAIQVIRDSKRASTSMLQRRLKIGYNRAARIMELLEAEGIVGPENGSSPREILKDLESL